MDYHELNTHVMKAIEMLYERDRHLVSRRVAEWSLAHRLAVYLEDEFPTWNLDCEYNRQGPERESKRNAGNAIRRPDIVIHHRGQAHRDHNLLVIEMKHASSDVDAAEVCEYTKVPSGRRCFQYQYGLAFSLDPRPNLRWYSGGAELALTRP
jgi:hypothetical protein